MILDVGPETAKAFAEILKTSKTILWNGQWAYLKSINSVKARKLYR